MVPTVAILLAFTQLGTSSVLPRTLEKRLGCYSGFNFNTLHGGVASEHDLSGEVASDIDTTCQLAAGKTIKAAEPFWLCTNWQKTFSDHETCYDDCTTGCSGVGAGGRGGELSSVLCTAGCDPNCDPGPDLSAYNHIDWAIEVRDGQTEQHITYETCVNAFKTELGGCASGSEQNHAGFWFRIDPSEGKCPGT